MIKTILWDFDGVILDSMKIKGEGFVELFSNYDKKYTDELYRYHFEHGGISRFDKIRYFFNGILHVDIDDKSVLSLADSFATIIGKRLYNRSNLIADSLKFIEKNYQNYEFHIVSGAEHNELNRLCHFFELENYFITINGSPKHKDLLIKELMIAYNYNKDETILIGDALSDLLAARKNSIGFYGYNNSALNHENYIDTFENFTV